MYTKSTPGGTARMTAGMLPTADRAEFCQPKQSPFGRLPPIVNNLTVTPILDILSTVRGAVAHLGERYNRTVEARGSSPLSSIGTPTG